MGASEEIYLKEMEHERFMFELAIVQRMKRAGLLADADYVASSFGLTTKDIETTKEIANEPV